MGLHNSRPAGGGKKTNKCGVCGGPEVASVDECSEVTCPRGVDACGVCGGSNSTCTDCAGVVNGGAVVDGCGTCGGACPLVGGTKSNCPWILMLCTGYLNMTSIVTSHILIQVNGCYFIQPNI